MEVLASFMTSRFGEWRQSWHGTAPTKGGQPLLGAPDLYEGILAVLDWDCRKVTRRVVCDTPSGFCWRDGCLYLCSMLGNRVYIMDRQLRTVSTLSCPQMNDLHTIVPTSRGLLLASSGLDGIIEISDDGRLLWSWLASQNGYSRTPDGIVRHVSIWDDLRRRDHRTQLQTTHLNSAVFEGVDETKVLATLFHQGQLVRIDRKSGRVDVLVKGMAHAHAVRPAPDGMWTCCDSQNGSVVILDRNYSIRYLVEGHFDWPQDALLHSDGLLYVGDANHNRIVRCTFDGHVIDQFVYPAEWKLFHFDVLE